MSIGLIFTSSLKRRNPANYSRQAVARRMSDSEFDLVAPSTILPSNSIDTGFFFVTGLANILYKPSDVARTNGCELGDGRPDAE